MGKKNFHPKDIHDLEDIFYNPQKVEKKSKYLSFFDSKYHDKIREAEAKQIMKHFGKSEKIATSYRKTTEIFQSVENLTFDNE